jgi:hypothetical protein
MVVVRVIWHYCTRLAIPRKMLFGGGALIVPGETARLNERVVSVSTLKIGMLVLTLLTVG